MFYVTLSVVGWINVLDRNIYKEILVSNLKYCQEKEGLQLFAYVIMSNHLHMVAAREGKDDLTELLGRFKSFTAKKILNEIADNIQESRKDWMLKLFEHYAQQSNQYDKYHFWQYTNHPTSLFTTDVIRQKINYIHQNPVRAGLVNYAENYVYSSACLDSPIKTLEI
ncbi:MAG: transposase [Bacteroidetes bacterium]|nr:transposase [Bacteroidota bacterium]